MEPVAVFDGEEKIRKCYDSNLHHCSESYWRQTDKIAKFIFRDNNMTWEVIYSVKFIVIKFICIFIHTIVEIHAIFLQSSILFFIFNPLCTLSKMDSIKYSNYPLYRLFYALYLLFYLFYPLYEWSIYYIGIAKNGIGVFLFDNEKGAGSNQETWTEWLHNISAYMQTPFLFYP